jgi:hypothetical protein
VDIVNQCSNIPLLVLFGGEGGESWEEKIFGSEIEYSFFFVVAKLFFVESNLNSDIKLPLGLLLVGPRAACGLGARLAPGSLAGFGAGAARVGRRHACKSFGVIQVVVVVVLLRLLEGPHCYDYSY